MKAATLFATILLTAGAALAQPGDVLDYNPVQCMRGGDSAMLQLSVSQPGELRCYFRHINSTEWCSVDGQNLGKLSTVVMPKFEVGDEIEYFFVVLNGKRVVAKSPRVYRAKATDGCDGRIARHMLDVQVDCSRLDDVVPAGMEAGFSMPVIAARPNGSPASPTQQ